MRKPGKPRDPETGLDDFGARYNSSTLGRFMTPDPLPWIDWQHGTGSQRREFAAYLANPQHLDEYSYALNNPVMLTDPTGMNACGTNDDSTCHVTVTFQGRTRDAKGNYNDQFKNVRNQNQYNATATVRVNGKAVGTYLARTVPSGSGYATIANGTYAATLGTHHGHPALRLNGGGAIPVVGGRDPATGGRAAVGILVHISGKQNWA